jgi:hypothetical protein
MSVLFSLAKIQKIEVGSDASLLFTAPDGLTPAQKKRARADYYRQFLLRWFSVETMERSGWLFRSFRTDGFAVSLYFERSVPAATTPVVERLWGRGEAWAAKYGQTPDVLAVDPGKKGAMLTASNGTHAYTRSLSLSSSPSVRC